MKSKSFNAICAIVLLTTASACSQQTVSEQDATKTQNTEKPTKISGFDDYNRFFYGEDKCHIKIPTNLVSSAEKSDEVLDTAVINFYTMLHKELQTKDLKEALEKELHNAIARGCDINESYMGNRALETALLYNDKNMLDFLLNNGANPALKIENENPKINGLTLLEVAEKINQKPDADEQIKALANHLLKVSTVE